MGRKRIEMAELLRWAYREELPKVPKGGAREAISASASPSAWDAVRRYGELMTLIDETPNAHGCIWTGDDDAAPHGDALLVADAVRSLGGLSVQMPAGFDCLGDIAMMTEDERRDCNGRGFDIARAKGAQLSALVIRRAIMGRDPEWHRHGEVKRRMVRSANGKEAWFRLDPQPIGVRGKPVPVEVDGYDTARKRPFPDAYRKTYLSPDPSMLAAERIEYQTWVIGLDRLARALYGALVAFEACAPSASPWPWEHDMDRWRPTIVICENIDEMA